MAMCAAMHVDKYRAQASQNAVVSSISSKAGRGARLDSSRAARVLTAPSRRKTSRQHAQQRQIYEISCAACMLSAFGLQRLSGGRQRQRTRFAPKMLRRKSAKVLNRRRAPARQPRRGRGWQVERLDHPTR